MFKCKTCAKVFSFIVLLVILFACFSCEKGPEMCECQTKYYTVSFDHDGEIDWVEVGSEDYMPEECYMDGWTDIDKGVKTVTKCLKEEN